MRLAWFSPWPPQPSGIATCSADIVPALAAHGHGIDVFVDARRTPAGGAWAAAPPPPGAVRVQSAHDFVWRAGRGQYDLIVYQAGNSRLHDYIWPYLFRWPGLTVLHDARLHHARGSAHLLRQDIDAYRQEFAWSQPGTDPAAAELGVFGFAGTYYYLWPMTRAVVTASRLVACHARGAIAAVEAEQPGTPVEYVALGHGRETPVPQDVRNARRDALGLDSAAVAFGVFGALTAERRVPEILRAFQACRRQMPHVRLVLAGARDASLDVDDLLRTLDLERDVTVLASPDDQTFDELVAAIDVALCLRWPTALETSGPWLRALAAARPTVTIDLAHQTHVPGLDPRSWTPLYGAVTGGPPVTVGIDILDEAHSLGLAMRRLATDASLRKQLGTAARAYWEREHSLARMTADYLHVLEKAAVAPAPAVDLPVVLRPDPLAALRQLLAGFGDRACVFG